jgi:RimJ/RimL family protein N-acetyltransferase
MIISEIPFVLRDGRSALLRSPRDEDIPGLLEYLRVTAAETEFLLRYPEECDKFYSAQAEKNFIDRINAADNGAMLVCIVDGRVAGNCDIQWSRMIKLRHRATVAIALMKEFWGLGIGTRMMQELIRIAEADEKILQLELDFIEGNSRARALYEKMGFRICGMRPDAIRLKDGTLLGEYNMIRKIER